MTLEVITLCCLFLLHVNALEWSAFVEEIQEGIRNSSTYVLPTNNNAFFNPYNESSHKFEDYGTYDFIIIGGGTAGGVLANRLTENKFTVLVIEAGREDPAWAAVLGLSTFLFNSDWNWGYSTTRQQNSCLGSANQKCLYPRGKSLGGSSVINGGFYARGNAKDFDKWAKMGNAGWSYKDCLPYFKKPEKAEFTIDIERYYHGFNGLEKTDVPDDTPGLTTTLIEAFKELGKKQRDYNGFTQNGVSRAQFLLDSNKRVSTSSAFIKPVRNRPNLNITLESLVTKIRLSKSKAVGVEFVRKGIKYFAKANKEVIVSAGSINSPQVLMLSGIGPATELNRHGIHVVADLPVGENLMDHMLFPGVYCRTNQTHYNNTLLENLMLWRKAQRPLVVGYGVQTVTYSNFNKFTGQPYIELLAHIPSNAFSTHFRYNDKYVKAFEEINELTDINLNVFLMQPYSSGKVTLQSKDPKDYPLIDLNSFSDERDLESMYMGIQTILKLNKTDTFKNWQSQVRIIPFPGCDDKYEKMSRDWWYCGIKHTATSTFHPIGTTSMGPNPKNSVVNSELKVHGIQHLRVVDAGVMPSQVSGHLNAAVVMIAEKIADAIKLEHNN